MSLDKNIIILGDCVEVLRQFPENSIDSVVTDPPYGLGFMNKEWDNPQKQRALIEREKARSIQRFLEGQSPTKAPFTSCVRPGLPIKGAKEGRWYQDWLFKIWSECFRVLKPGGYLLSFGGTRTYHRLACAIEDAGFEVRDMLEWIYGCGFPKSMNIGKEIDKRQGNQREVIGQRQVHDIRGGALMEARVPELKKEVTKIDYNYTRGNTPWEGWGTALKPAHEPICLARKPISEKTIIDNILKWGTGGLNIDACRVPYGGEQPNVGGRANHGRGQGYGYKPLGKGITPNMAGRFPANLIHDGSQEVLSLFPVSEGGYFPAKRGKSAVFGNGDPDNHSEFVGKMGDSGSAARFFYCAKAGKTERELGLDNFPEQPIAEINKIGGSKNTMKTGSGNERRKLYKNIHPTVKPVALIRYLVRLVTPPGGLVLDPFIGSGTTALACMLEGCSYIGIEKEQEYVEIALARTEYLKNSLQGS